jgi:hypothetical protein
LPGDNAIRAVNQCGIGKTKFPNVRGDLPHLRIRKRPGAPGEKGQNPARIPSEPYSTYSGA